MTKKEYNSPEYFAQNVKAFLRQEHPYQKREGGKWRAEQHLNHLIFSIYNEEFCLTFNKNKSKIVASLDERVNGKYEHCKTLKLKPKRSKTGRLFADYIPRVLFKELFNRK